MHDVLSGAEFFATHRLTEIAENVMEGDGSPHSAKRSAKKMRMMSLFKSTSKQPFFKMFSRKRSNKGAMWASLIGLGISAVMMKMNKGQKRDTNENGFKNVNSYANGSGNTNSNGNANANPNGVGKINFQNLMKNNPLKGNSSMMNDAALAEFSEELMSKALQNNNQHKQ